MVFVIRVDFNNRTGGPPKKTFFAEAVDGALAALDALGIRAQFRSPPPGVVRDSVRADGPPAGGRLHRRPSVEDVREVVSCRAGQVAARLLRRGGPSVNTLPLLVADSVTAQGRTLLTDAGVVVRPPWPAPPARAPISRYRRPNLGRPRPPGPAIRGRSGIAVAYWLCAHPEGRVSPNRHAASLRLAPSTISTTARHVAEAGLVDDVGAAVARTSHGGWRPCGAPSEPGFSAPIRSIMYRLTLLRRPGA